MKYKRRKISTVTLFDGYVEDDEDIRKILSSLCGREMDVSLKLKNESAKAFARITEVGQTEFKFEVLGYSSLVRHARVEDVDCLEVVSNDEFTVEVKPGITRWNLLNPMDSDFFEGDGNAN